MSIPTELVGSLPRPMRLQVIARYADPEIPYEVKRRPGQPFRQAYKYDQYEHLARIKEWLTQEIEEDFG
jgi:hypothetical protein